MKPSFIIPLKKWLRAHPWDTLLLLGLGLTGLVTGWWAKIILYDDALITFRVAENLAYGRGFVYNVGEPVQVTTTPLYTILLAGGTWLFGSAIEAALPLNLALSTLIPLLAYDIGRRLSGRITGVAGALLLTLAPLLILAFSMESYLYVTLILGAMWAYVVDQPRLTGVLVGLTALVRGDGALLGASLLPYDLIARRRLRWALILPAILIPIAWYSFALFYYGHPFPATLGAKVAQGQFDWLGANFLDGLAFYWDRWLRIQNYEGFRLLPYLWGLGVVWAVWRERLWLILVARDALYVAVFVALSVPAAEWYYAALMPGVALLTGRGIQLVAEGISSGLAALTHRLNGRIVPASLLAVLASGLAAPLLTVLLMALYPATEDIISQHPDWKAQIYPDTARWLAENTNASANFATIDIGHLGYWSERPIIDIVGLAQPDVAPHIAQGDFGYAIQHYQPDMVLLGFSWLPEVQSRDWFQQTYVPRHAFKFPTYDEPLILFSRPQGVKVQSETVPSTAIQPLNVDFNRQISLTGYHLNTPLTPGKPLEVTLFWRAEAMIEVDFTVFVQVVDAQNRVIAQRDRPPQDGFYGTRYWQPGERIIDAHTILLPNDLPLDRYDVLLGFYDPLTGQRLQILDDAGIFKSDHVRLSNLPTQGL